MRALVVYGAADAISVVIRHSLVQSRTPTEMLGPGHASTRCSPAPPQRSAISRRAMAARLGAVPAAAVRWGRRGGGDRALDVVVSGTGKDRQDDWRPVALAFQWSLRANPPGNPSRGACGPGSLRRFAPRKMTRAVDLSEFITAYEAPAPRRPRRHRRSTNSKYQFPHHQHGAVGVTHHMAGVRAEEVGAHPAVRCGRCELITMRSALVPSARPQNFLS